MNRRTYDAVALYIYYASAFQRTEFGMIMMAVENLAEKCRRRLDPELEEMDLDMQLQIVQVCDRNFLVLFSHRLLKATCG